MPLSYLEKWRSSKRGWIRDAWFILNNAKTPNFTFLGVKLGVCFAIYWFSAFIAEREGFEPPVPLSTSVFKTGAIDHSATSPKVFCVKECGLSVFDVAKVYQKSEPCKRLAEKIENNFIFTPFYLLFLFIDCQIP